MYIYSSEELNCIIACQGSGLFLHTLYLSHQLLTTLRLLTGPNTLTKTETLYVIHRLLTWSISLTGSFIVNHLVGSIPTEGFPWPRFPQLSKYGVMNSLCVWLFILFNIIGLLSYACDKVINNIQLWAKGLKILIHPLSIIYF